MIHEFTETDVENYLSELSESVPKDAPEGDYADPPGGLYVGDAKHAGLAVQAVSSKGFRGNKAKSSSKPGVKGKIASAVKKFYKGKEQSYYLSWLRTGKKPDQKPVSEMTSIGLSPFSFEDEAKMPTVPTLPGVNEAALIAGDSDPCFVTRPIAVIGGVSENGLRYDEPLLSELERQIREKRPPARRGHVAETDRSSAFPPDEGTWIGVLRAGDTLYGKCYVHDKTPLKEMIRTRRAAGGKISNSIWGGSDFADNDDGTLRAVNTELESIDFVPPERAALKALGGDFEVTSEMEGSNPMAETHDDAAQDAALFKQLLAKHESAKVHEALHESGKAHEVAEMHRAGCAECAAAETKRFRETSPEETYQRLSEAHRKHIAEMYAKETGHTLTKLAEVSQNIAEMTQHKTALAEMKASMAEMGKVIAQYQRREFEDALDRAIDGFFVAQPMKTPKGIEGQANLKKTFRKSALAEMAGMDGGQAVSNIDASTKKTWDEEIKGLAEMFYAAAGGPPVAAGPVVPGAAQRAGKLVGFDPQTNSFTPEFMQHAAQVTGMGRRTPKTGGDQ